MRPPPVSAPLRVSDFDFDLPSELMAQAPPSLRGDLAPDAPRAAVGRNHARRVCGPAVAARPDDLLVTNDTRVFPARLLGRRLPGGGAVECLLVSRGRRQRRRTRHARCGTALVTPGARVRPGTRTGVRRRRRTPARRGAASAASTDASSGSSPATAARYAPPCIDSATSHCRPTSGAPTCRRIASAIRRCTAGTKGRSRRPRPGLHFTSELLRAIDRAGIETHGNHAACRLRHLPAGAGGGRVPTTAWRARNTRSAPRRRRRSRGRAAAGRRIVAVGTTTTRTLESLTLGPAGDVAARRGATDTLHCAGPPFPHRRGPRHELPRAALVAADAGLGVCGHSSRCVGPIRKRCGRYRFYSYGDAMAIL